MPITFTPNPVDPGAMVTARLRYAKPVPPVPTDVHIDVQQADGSWRAVTGYDHIPAGMDPVAGFDVPFSSGNPHVGGRGEHAFQVRWTFNGEEIIGATERASLSVGPPMSSIRRKCLGLLPPEWDCTKVLKAIGDALRREKH